MLQSRMPFKSNNEFERANLMDETAETTVNLSTLSSFARRQKAPFLICCIIGLLLGALYLTFATPLYTASAYLLIDNRQVRAVQELSPLSDSPLLDTATVESQVEVLRSEKVALAVIDQLKLNQNPMFSNPPPSWIDEFLAKLGLKGGAEDKNSPDFATKQHRKLLKMLDRDLTVSRVGRTFVLQVDYTSPDPRLSANIANAYTDAYLFEQVNSRIESAHRARNWLSQRTEELRELSVNADLAAQKFRADHDLLSTKGTLISEQQYNEMTTQLVTAQAETAQAQARYQRLKNIVEGRQTEAAVTESLKDTVVSDLRTKYLEASKRKAEFERKLGRDHIAVINLKSTMEEIGKLLFEELGRIAQIYKTEYEVAAAREKALTDHLKAQQGVAVAANDAQAQLRQLEQKAESYKLIYQTYLQRYQEAAQHESFPMTDAHVITAASQPLEPSRPRKPIVLIFSALLGAAAGAGLAIIRDSMDRVFRTIEQVRNELGVEVLGMLPLLPSHSLSKGANEKGSRQIVKTGLANIAPILRYSIDHPFSAYAETLRSAKVAADTALPDRPMKIIALVSLLPNEGKSTVAKNFGSLLALQGARTLLIDADTRNAGLSRGIGCETPTERQSIPLSRVSDLCEVEDDSGLEILPSIYAKDDLRTAAGFSGETLQSMLRNLDPPYDYVVIDLPPIGPLINARSLAPAIDAFIFVIAWGQTSRGAVRSALANEHLIKTKLLGIILNKVDTKKLSLYEHFNSDGYYYKQYQSYFSRKE